MAARHLQKLRAAQIDAPEEPEEVSLSEDEEIVAAKAPFNPFDLLTDEEPAGAKEDESEEEEGPREAAPSQPQSRKSKKKKKKVKKDAEEDAPASKQAQQEEDLDKVLAELNIVQQQADTQPAPAPSGREAEPPLLNIDPRKLRADEELRRIFGSRVMRAEERDAVAGGNGLVGGNRRMRRAIARGAVRRTPLRRGLLVAPRDTWPPFDGGVSMEPAGTAPDGSQRFRYVHSAAYQGVQRLFEEAQASHDPNNIMALLQHHPYHIDALMAMFELHRAMGQHEYADEMLQRCLYGLEMAWHPWFNPVSGSCRLSYEEEPNRPLFVALLRHIQGLSRQGLHATALEAAKLLLKLDPADPQGMLFCIDYFALRAQAYAWLVRLSGSDMTAGELSFSGASAPNLAFSVPLARLRLWQQRRERADAAAARAATSGGTSGRHQQQQQADCGDAPDEQEVQESVDELSYAALLHPLAVVRLMHRLQEKGVGADAEWQSMLAKRLFARADADVSASLSHLTDIFVERHHLLWKAADAQQWLRQACALAVGDALGVAARDYACARREAFPPDEPRNLYGHLRVADFSDAVAALPPEELQAAVMGPPPQPAGPRLAAGLAEGDAARLARWREQGMDAREGREVIAHMERAAAALAAAGVQVRQVRGEEAQEDPLLHLQQLAQRGPVAIDEEALRQMHPLQALLATMLPWINAGEAPDYAAGEEAPPDQDRQGGERHAVPAGGGGAPAAAAAQRGQGGEPDVARAAGNGLMEDYGAYGFESDTDEDEADSHPAGH